MTSRVVQPYHGPALRETALPTCCPLAVTQLLPWGPGARSIPGKRVVKHVLEAPDLYALRTPKERGCVFEADCVKAYVGEEPWTPGP